MGKLKDTLVQGIFGLIQSGMANRWQTSNVERANEMLLGVTGKPLSTYDPGQGGSSVTQPLVLPGSGQWRPGVNWQKQPATQPNYPLAGQKAETGTTGAGDFGPLPTGATAPATPKEPAYAPFTPDSPAGYAHGQTEPYTDPFWWMDSRGGQGFSFEGHQVRPGENTVDLSTYFLPSASASDAYAAGYGAGFDWNSLKTQVANILNDARLNPAAVAGTVGGFFNDPSIDAFRSSAAEDIKSASGQRTANATQELVARGLARGMSMEQIQDQLRQLDLSEGRSRTGQVAGVEAAAEQMLNQTNLARAGASASAYGQAQDINQNLARMGAGALSELGGAEGGQFLQHARDMGSAATWDINALMQGKSAGYGAMSGISDQMASDYAKAAGINIDDARLQLQTVMSILSQASGQQSGINFMVPDLAGYYANAMQADATRQANQGQSSWGFQAGPISWSS